MREFTNLDVRGVADARLAVADADIICTTTAAADPVLFGNWLRTGAHVNLVGSSGPLAAEADNDLVHRSRYLVDSREAALVKAGEFLRCKQAGLVGDDHIRGEIGEVFAGQPGRAARDEVTVYKSLGHAVQDLAATAYLYEKVSGVGLARGV